MTILGKRAIPETIRSIDSATFTGSYQKLGTVITNPSVLLKIVNNSSVLVTISFDGVNDHDVLPANAFTLYDFGSDSQSVSGDHRLALAAGTQVWIKGAGSTGLVFLITFFQGG